MYLNFVYSNNCIELISSRSESFPPRLLRHGPVTVERCSTVSVGSSFTRLGQSGKTYRHDLDVERMQTMCINVLYIYIQYVCVCLFVRVICCLYIDRYDIARLHISYMLYTYYVCAYMHMSTFFFYVTCAILRHSLHRFFKRMAEGRCTSPGYGSNFGIFLAGNQRTKPGRVARPQGFPRTARHGWLPNIYII